MEYEDLVLVEEDDIIEEEKSKISFFDLFNDISNHGKFISEYIDENKSMPPEYNSFMMIKSFSNFIDTIFVANEMNKWYNIPDEIQYRFMYNVIEPRKRYSKWFKNKEDKEPIQLLADYFGCTVKEMYKNLSALTKEDKEHLLKTLDPERFKFKK